MKINLKISPKKAQVGLFTKLIYIRGISYIKFDFIFEFLRSKASEKCILFIS